MPSSHCQCRCKVCRVPDARHCRACFAPGRAVAATLRQLKAASGTHSPSVVELDRVLPGVVQVDACFLSNPYATDEVVRRLGAIDRDRLARMVSHYPSQSGAVATVLAPTLGVPHEQLVVANGACEIIAALLATVSGSMLLSLPTFSAYYEFATGAVIPHRLDPAHEFRLDLDELDVLVERHEPDTVVIINPNNPDGGQVPHDALAEFVDRLSGRTRQVIVDESFAAFSTLGAPPSLAPLVGEMPHLVVLNSLSKSHGIPGLRAGYAVMTPLRARQLRRRSLWNLNAYAEWFCELLADDGYQRAYEAARRRYIRAARSLFSGLAELPGAKLYPSAANFALLELDRPAGDVALDLLVRHGVYVRDCADKWGLDGDRFLRVAARSEQENTRVLAALTDVLREQEPLVA